MSAHPAMFWKWKPVEQVRRANVYRAYRLREHRDFSFKATCVAFVEAENRRLLAAAHAAPHAGIPVV